MAQWRKVIVSGSNAELNQISASGNIVPGATNNNVVTLGTATKPFGDLFLGSGGVINLDNGDITLTQSSNLLTIAGGSTRVDKLEIDNANNHIDVSTDLILTAAADIVLSAAGGNIEPGSNDQAALGAADTAFSDLFLANGAVVNFNNGDVTLTHASNALTIDGGNTILGEGFDISGSFTSTGSFGRVEVAGDLQVKGNTIVSGTITFGDSDSDAVNFGADITSDIIPNASDSHNLGSDAQRWDTLFLSGSLSASGGPHDLDSNSTITMDAAGAVSIGAGAASDFTTTAAAITINGKTGINLQEDGSNVIAIDTNRDVLFSQTGGSTSDPDVEFDGYTRFDGVLEVALATQSTSTSTGALIVDGGVGIAKNLTVGGNLDVNGTLTTINTTNLQVKDQLIQLGSGSESGDRGILATTDANGSGSAFFFDDSANRWGLSESGSTGNGQVEFVAKQYLVSVSSSAAGPLTEPDNFGNGETTFAGMMHVDTDKDELYIYF